MKASCALLLTDAISLFPPIKTVSLPILASNFPCLERRFSRSFGVAPAISTIIKLFPAKSEIGRTFKSVNKDLKVLERFGFIEFIEEKTKNRIRHKPEVVVDSIKINLEISLFVSKQKEQKQKIYGLCRVET